MYKFVKAFYLLVVIIIFVALPAVAGPQILNNPPAGSQLWNNDGDGYESNQGGQTYAVGPAYPSLNGYQGNSFAVSNDGQYYVQLKSGGWVNAQNYSSSLDNSPPPPAPQPSESQPANNSGNDDTIAQTLCIIVKALQGSIGKAIATIAIVVLGVGLFLGKLSWPLAVAIAIGIGLIFGSSEMVTWLSNQSSSGC